MSNKVRSIVSAITAGCLALAGQTALALPNLGPSGTPDIVSGSSESTRVLRSDSFTDEAGRQISYELWIDEGVIYGDARIVDTRDNHLELWREGDVIYYEGVIAGEATAGEMPADFDADSDQAFCPGLLILICIGALFLGSGSGCAHETPSQTGCAPEVPGTSVPGGQGGNPEGGGDDEPVPPGGGDAE
jgi:hypothetical protein